LLGSATFTNETSSGWQQVSFSRPGAISASTVYIVSCWTGGGYFGATSGTLTTNETNGPLVALKNGGTAGTNGVYGVGKNSFPSRGEAGINFWVDVTFTPSTSPTAGHAGPVSGTTAGRALASSYVVVTPPDAQAKRSMIFVGI
jgi:hypothetical protein